MKRATAVLVVLLKKGTTIAELSDLAEILKYHRIVEDARLEIRAPGLAKALPRAGSADRKKAGSAR